MANILLLMCETARHTATVDDHLRGFEKFSSHCITLVDSRAINSVDMDLEIFDCIVFHYSIVISNSRYISDCLTDRLKAFSGLKMLFIQDEMRWVNATCAKIQELNITTIFTVVNESVIRKIYKDPWFDKVRFELTLTGYVSEKLLEQPIKPYEARAIDVVYRARKLPAWCGAFAQEKWQIGHRFDREAKGYELLCDISSRESDRVYGKKWVDLLMNSKSTLGVESGASFVDFTGKVAPSVELYERQNFGASFDEVSKKFLEGRDGEIVIHVISPRCFEAAALKTLMIMYEGDYSGILIKDKHYVALARDHSNLDDVIAIIKDPARAEAIIEAAYKEIACSDKWTFKSFINDFDTVVEEEFVNQNVTLKSEVNSSSFIEFKNKSSRALSKIILKYKILSTISHLSMIIYDFLGKILPQCVKRPVLNTLLALYGFVKARLSFLVS